MSFDRCGVAAVRPKRGKASQCPFSSPFLFLSFSLSSLSLFLSLLLSLLLFSPSFLLSVPPPSFCTYVFKASARARPRFSPHFRKRAPLPLSRLCVAISFPSSSVTVAEGAAWGAEGQRSGRTKRTAAQPHERERERSGRESAARRDTRHSTEALIPQRARLFPQPLEPTAHCGL